MPNIWAQWEAVIWAGGLVSLTDCPFPPTERHNDKAPTVNPKKKRGERRLNMRTSLHHLSVNINAFSLRSFRYFCTHFSIKTTSPFCLLTHQDMQPAPETQTRGLSVAPWWIESIRCPHFIDQSITWLILCIKKGGDAWLHRSIAEVPVKSVLLRLMICWLSRT